MSNLEVDQVVAWVNGLPCKERLRLIRDAANNRLCELEHQDEHGAGADLKAAGYRPLRQQGVARQA